MRIVELDVVSTAAGMRGTYNGIDGDVEKVEVAMFEVTFRSNALTTDARREISRTGADTTAATVIATCRCVKGAVILH